MLSKIPAGTYTIDSEVFNRFYRTDRPLARISQARNGNEANGDSS